MLINTLLSIIIMNKFSPLFNFCTKIMTSNKNSINPLGQFIAYGYYFPKEWSEEYIYSQIDASKKNISHLQVMRNRIGQPTGKVLFKFYNQQAMNSYIKKYNEDFIITKQSAHRVILKPFELKTELTKETSGAKRTNHAVSVKNLDFDITQQQLQRIAKDYGKVELIQMQIRPNGLNNGLATIYFKKAKQAQDFSYFCHNLVIRQRKLSAEVINMSSKNKVEVKQLQEPKVVMQANQRLYKKMLNLQVRQKEEKKQKE